MSTGDLNTGTLNTGTFWTRRQEAVAREALAEQEAAQATERAETEAALAARDDADILRELDLPEPEALDSAEAVRDFLGSAVPQRLKTRALRRLWRLNPMLANLDGLVDYGQDFTDSATVIENMQTAYQVGKGMLSHIEALAAQAEAKAKAAEAPSVEDDMPADSTPEEIAPGETPPEDPDVPVILAEGARPAPACAIAAQDDTTRVEANRRRMRFEFKSQGAVVQA